MFNFTDTEVGLAMRYRREVDDMTRDAQRLVDTKDADIASLRRQLRDALDALADERALRLAAEIKLDRLNAILDAPLN